MKDKIKKLSELATKYEDLKEMQGKTQKLFKDYEEFKIPMVFIGEFSAGKSSLINELYPFVKSKISNFLFPIYAASCIIVL
jgi:ribosome biogenesis GTPase A